MAVRVAKPSAFKALAVLLPMPSINCTSSTKPIPASSVFVPVAVFCDTKLTASLEASHGLEPLLQLPGVHLPDSLVLLGNHGVDPIGLVAYVLVDPVELHGELLGGEPDRAQHTKPTGLADLDDDVATVGEGEDGDLDAEPLADLRSHGFSLPLRVRLTPLLTSGVPAYGPRIGGATHRNARRFAAAACCTIVSPGRVPCRAFFRS